MQDVSGNVLERLAAQGRDRCVVILDDSADYSLLARLKTGRRATGIVVISYAPTQLYGTLLLAIGVACVAHDARSSDILEAVRSVAERRPIFLARDGRRREPSYPDQLRNLTRRERDVLKHLTAGQSSSQIALALGIAPETARTHIASVRKKLGVASKRDLIGLSLPADFYSG
jgi:DNA-binding NarL/FixJ family response regulator